MFVIDDEDLVVGLRVVLGAERELLDLVVPEEQRVEPGILVDRLRRAVLATLVVAGAVVDVEMVRSTGSRRSVIVVSAPTRPATKYGKWPWNTRMPAMRSTVRAWISAISQYSFGSRTGIRRG